MALVACCWELGNGFGHIGELLQWARPLKARGHRVVFFVSRLFPAAKQLHREGFECLPGMTLPPSFPATRTSTYAQLLLLNGFRDHENLAIGLSSWATIFQSFKPGLVLCNYAPAAALAARAMDIPCVLSGTSFSTPPAMTTRQPYLGDTDETATADLETLRTKLEMAGRLSGFPSRVFSLDDPLAECIPVLQTFQEFDLYQRENADYVGSGFGLQAKDEPPAWPMASRPKVFAYVGGPPQAIDRFLSIIPRVNAQFMAVVRSDGGNLRPPPSYSNAVFLNGPINLKAVFPEVDLVINHGAHGTFCGSLRAGKAMVLAPNYPEQVCHSRKVEALGAASVVMPSETPIAFRDAVENTLGNIDRYRQAAESFSARYPEALLLARQQAVVDHLESLLH